jgi:hypothetical protein
MAMTGKVPSEETIRNKQPPMFQKTSRRSVWSQSMAESLPEIRETSGVA